MATVAHVLKKIDDTLAVSVPMVFRLYDGPHCRSDAITSNNRITVTTNATTAAFSTTLREGQYRVEWRISAEFSSVIIAVPAGSGTYNFNSIVVIDDVDSSMRNVFDDWAEAAAASVPATSYILILHEDDAGNRDVLFIRSVHANVLAFTPDGVNVVADAINQRFLRQGVDPANL